MWRPGAKKMDSSSLFWTQSRWMVTSTLSWSSGSEPSTRPMQKYGPASSGVLVGAGSSLRRSKPSSSARCTTSWHGTSFVSVSTGGVTSLRASPICLPSSRVGAPSRRLTRRRLASKPTSTRASG